MAHTEEYRKYKEYLSKYLQSNTKYPRSILVEITPQCNLRCVFCPCYISGEEVYDDRNDPNGMTFENFKKFIDHIVGKFNFQICFTYSGEALLNRDISKMVKYLNENNIPSIIHSNAMPLSEEKIKELVDFGLDRFAISFDGGTKKTYEDIRRGAKFEIVIQNIKNLIEYRNSKGLLKPFVEMQMIVTKTTKKEIPQFHQLCKELDIDNAYVKSMLIYQDTKNKDYVNFVKEYFVADEIARYEMKNGELVLKDKHGCPEIDNCVITSDGDVVSCCFDVHGKYKQGNAIETSLEKIWDSYNDFRKIKMETRSLPICDFCNTSQHLSKELTL